MGGEFLNYLRRFDDAHAAVDRALEISPNDEDAIAAKADLLQSEGRLAEAAQQLAGIPADSTADRVVLTRLSQAEDERRFDAGIALIKRKVSSLKPDEPIDNATKILLAHLGYCQEWAGRPDEARASFERALQALKPSAKSPASSQPTGLHYFVASVYAGLGDKINALDEAHGALKDFSNDAILKPTAEIMLAKIQARFGDLDSAIAALPHLLEVPAGLNRADLRFDPMWDPLRKDPRFQKLCQGK